MPKIVFKHRQEHAIRKPDGKEIRFTFGQYEPVVYSDIHGGYNHGERMNIEKINEQVFLMMGWAESIDFLLPNGDIILDVRMDDILFERYDK